MLFCDALGSALMATPLVMWLSDMRHVLCGTLSLRPEDAVFYSAVVTWLLPSGYLAGYHFRILGRPFDYQVFSSFTLVGGICTVGWRQFARWGAVDNTYLSCLTAGAAAGALNVLRFLQDLPEMRKGSVLQRELSEGQFRTVSVLFWSTGLLISGHQLWLGHPVATFLSLSLNAAAGLLLYVAMMRVDALQGTADATMALGGLAGLMFMTTMSWWIWDGVKLLRGKVVTSGERVVSKDDMDEDTATSVQLKPPAHWRNYKTPAGHDYYFDPATERIHYLSATGSNNYAIDPMRNTAVGYNSLHELEAKLAAGYTGEADAESDDEADGESAPLSPSKDASHAAQKGCKTSVKGIAGKRVRIAAEGGRGDESPPGGLEAAQTV